MKPGDRRERRGAGPLGALEPASGTQAASNRERSVCVVIPALNEEEHLPRTVDAVAAQTLPPSEVIVADGGSTDRTADIARERDCRVVPGGLPGAARNNGARIARGRWLLFVDADVVPPPDALQEALAIAEARSLDALSCWFVPDSRGVRVRVMHWLSAGYFWLSTSLRWPHSIGGFLLIRRSLHEAVRGFDESVTVAEDQDYARRISRAGKYAFVRSPRVMISTRRFRSEGFLRGSARWVGIEIHRMVLGEVRRPLFRYFDAAARPDASDPAAADHGRDDAPAVVRDNGGRAVRVRLTRGFERAAARPRMIAAWLRERGRTIAVRRDSG